MSKTLSEIIQEVREVSEMNARNARIPKGDVAAAYALKPEYDPQDRDTIPIKLVGDCILIEGVYFDKNRLLHVIRFLVEE